MFDTVDHKILLSKMNPYGIKGILYEWFKIYLTNRQQFTTANNKQFELSNIEFGMPQGSILGTLLFLIYIHNLKQQYFHQYITLLMIPIFYTSVPP